MPFFEHRCVDCKEITEVLCKFEEDSQVCAYCGSEAKRIISAPQGIHFKGGGFYETEYGKGSVRKQQNDMIEATEKKLNKSLGGGDVNGL
jgi:putative FmdB family regulatory protein